MEIPEVIKKHSGIFVGAIVLVAIIFLVSRSKSGAASSGTSDYASQVAAANAANAASAVSIAGINSQVQIAGLQAGVATISATLGGQANLANIDAQKTVALSKIASDENVNLQGLDYQYDITNKQVENTRVLGLTQEDTKRLLATQENQTRLTLGSRLIDSQEMAQQAALELGAREIASNERIADFTSSRAITFNQVTGANQVAAIKAAKPSTFSSFLSNLGRGLGTGLGTLIGGL